MPAAQHGVYVVLVPFVLMALLALIGLTLTSGNGFVERSRLQNLLDAMAIAAATQVNMMNARGLATKDAKCFAPNVSPITGVLGVQQAVANVLRFHTNAAVNRPLRAALDVDNNSILGPADNLVIEYATQLTQDAFGTQCPATDPAQPIYVRIRLRRPIDTQDFLTGIVQRWLGQQGYDMSISGSAVAGPAAVMPIWNDQQSPVPAFVCDRSNPEDPQYPPAPDCAVAPNAENCSYGYVERVKCDLLGTGGTTVCADLSERAGTHTLALAEGVGWQDAMGGVPGANVSYPDGEGNVALTAGNLASQLLAVLTFRAQSGRTPMVVPVLSCQGGEATRLALAGYLCVETTDDRLAGLTVGLTVLNAGSTQGICGASSVIGGPGSRPPVRSDGKPVMPALWRIVLYRDPGARDS